VATDVGHSPQASRFFFLRLSGTAIGAAFQLQMWVLALRVVITDNKSNPSATPFAEKAVQPMRTNGVEWERLTKRLPINSGAAWGYPPLQLVLVDQNTSPTGVGVVNGLIAFSVAKRQRPSEKCLGK
jgi:hypothetical protein